MTTTVEAIRLVIWDLDETFWSGTLTEGGMNYRRDHHDIVVELARRGIISSICSKNDIATVRDVLQAQGIWDYFVLPSIDWSAKGPRLEALVEASQLRPQTILFIDDNPMNRAEAQRHVPGLQVADETCIALLLDNPLLRGKDDFALKRLAQYKLLERRQADQRQAAEATGGDNLAFLRSSGIKVSVEHDLEPHLDRAIELINRTNQLNFTKTRLPEAIEEARAELRTLLATHIIQAGIVRVRDNYGDYGYCGLYVMRNQRHTGKKLLHYCFSCRILNMGIEAWLYRRLDRPVLTVRGDVLTDLFDEAYEIDWIDVELPGVAHAAPGKRVVDTVFVRGGCDMRAISHYFGMVAGQVVEEFNTVRNGMTPIICHSAMAMHALDGVPAAAMQAARPLGYIDADFTSHVASEAPPGRDVWLLGFSLESGTPLYRHTATGALLPVALPGVKGAQRDPTALTAADEAADPAVLEHLRREFTFTGPISDENFCINVRRILSRARPGTSVFIFQANERLRTLNGRTKILEGAARRNELVKAVASEFAFVETLHVYDFIESEDEIAAGQSSHFDRMVYFRVFQHIMARMAAAKEAVLL